MPDREPEPWESGAAAPFLWIETAQGNVEVWALGEDRFKITAPGHEQVITGFEEVEKAADALAGRLGELGWAGFVARIAVQVSRPHGAGMHWTLAPPARGYARPRLRRRRESQPGALPIIYPRLVDPRRGWHMDERPPGRRRAEGPLHSPPLSNSQGHGQSSCPLGHPPQCPCDGNGLRVIEIRVARPDTPTVVSVAAGPP